MPIFTMVIGIIGCIIAAILHKSAIAGIVLDIVTDIVVVVILWYSLGCLNKEDNDGKRKRKRS